MDVMASTQRMEEGMSMEHSTLDSVLEEYPTTEHVVRSVKPDGKYRWEAAANFGTAEVIASTRQDSVIFTPNWSRRVWQATKRRR